MSAAQAAQAAQAGLAGLAGFEAWDGARYLDEYYRRVEADEAVTLGFISQACSRIPALGRALVFGIGPTVHHLLPLAPHVREIHVADYLESNLDHVRRWLRCDPQAHDWRAFGHHVLACEGQRSPSEQQIAQRERMVRSRVTRCLHGNADRVRPLPSAGPQCYEVVVSCYCAESATGDRSVWRRYLRNILRLLAPGGLFVTAALRRCHAYHVGAQRFACADIDEIDLAGALLECGVQPRQLQLEVHEVGLGERLGYDSILLAAATLPATGAGLAGRTHLGPGRSAESAAGHSPPLPDLLAGLPAALRMTSRGRCLAPRTAKGPR